MNNIIDIKKKYELLNILILGFLLILIGMIFIFQKTYFGSIFILVGLLIVTFKKGVLIDTKLKKIKYYKKFVFKIIGNWSDISDVQYIALVKVNLTQQMNTLTVPGTFSDVQIKLNFIMKNKNVVQVITDKKSKIMLLAEKISEDLKIDIYDNSEGKKLWIKYNEN